MLWVPLLSFGNWSETRLINTIGRDGMRYSTADFYVPTPRLWYSGAGPWHGINWLEEVRRSEIKAGDTLFSPFVAAGWHIAEEENVRPAQWLGLLKVLGVWGAEFYVRATSSPSRAFRRGFVAPPDLLSVDLTRACQRCRVCSTQASSRCRSRFRSLPTGSGRPPSLATHRLSPANTPTSSSTARQLRETCTRPSLSSQAARTSRSDIAYGRGLATGSQWHASTATSPSMSSQ